MKKIIITGTKGKTTVAHITDYIFQQFGYSTLRVDSKGSYINGKQDTTYEDSIKVRGKSPNIKPGRYIYGASKDGKFDNTKSAAILEASFACKTLGTGVKEHDVGILTNIYSDHINHKTIFTREDLLQKKSFALYKLKANGHFIFNLDDNLIRKFVLDNKSRNAVFVPISRNTGKIVEFKKTIRFENFATIENGKFIFSLKNEEFQIEIDEIPYTYEGKYIPMLENYMFSLMAFFSISNQEFNRKKVSKILKNYSIPRTYGRYIDTKIKNRRIIIDYAHEIESLRELVNIFKENKKSITLITRIAPDRKDKFIKEFAQDLCDLDINKLIVYDKVDGIERKQYIGRSIQRDIGETAEIIINELEKQKPNFKYQSILNEQNALKEAFLNSKDGEIIILIQDNIKKDLEMLELLKSTSPSNSS